MDLDIPYVTTNSIIISTIIVVSLYLAWRKIRKLELILIYLNKQLKELEWKNHFLEKELLENKVIVKKYENELNEEKKLIKKEAARWQKKVKSNKFI